MADKFEIIPINRSESSLKEIHIVFKDLNFTGYYWKNDSLLFVIDKSLDEISPDFRLIINPDTENPDKKWDSILSGDYRLNLETIRPKQNNKYQKLDIEYFGLALYEKFISVLSSDSKNSKYLNDLYQKLLSLKIRNSVENTQKRIEEYESDVSKSNETIKKTQKTIEKLNDTITFFSERLANQKIASKKDSSAEMAEKISKTEDNVSRNKSKLSKSNVRLKKAIKRFETATKDLEDTKNRLKLLSKLSKNIKEGDLMDDVNQNNGVEPIIEQEPSITNSETAGNPVSLDEKSQEISIDNPFALPEPVLESEKISVEKPEATHITNNFSTMNNYVNEPTISSKSIEDFTAPIDEKTEEQLKIFETNSAQIKPLPFKDEKHDESFIKTFTYYGLLIVLILLSILTLDIYKRKFLDKPEVISASQQEFIDYNVEAEQYIDEEPVIEEEVQVSAPNEEEAIESEYLEAEIIETFPEPEPEPEIEQRKRIYNLQPAEMPDYDNAEVRSATEKEPFSVEGPEILN